MNHEDLEFIDCYCDIPEILYHQKSGKPHAHCRQCDIELLHSDVPYFIEQAFQDGKVIFDYAMCMKCYHSMGQDLISKESRAALERLFSERVDLFKRRDLFTQKYGASFEDWTKYCLLSAKPIAECNEYQWIAQCENDQLLFYYMPFAISDEGIEEIMSVLSEKTKEDLSDYTDTLVDDPQLKRDRPRHPVLI